MTNLNACLDRAGGALPRADQDFGFLPEVFAAQDPISEASVRRESWRWVATARHSRRFHPWIASDEAVGAAHAYAVPRTAAVAPVAGTV